MKRVRDVITSIQYHYISIEEVREKIKDFSIDELRKLIVNSEGMLSSSEFGKTRVEKKLSAIELKIKYEEAKRPDLLKYFKNMPLENRTTKLANGETFTRGFEFHPEEDKLSEDGLEVLKTYKELLLEKGNRQMLLTHSEYYLETFPKVIDLADNLIKDSNYELPKKPGLQYINLFGK